MKFRIKNLPYEFSEVEIPYEKCWAKTTNGDEIGTSVLSHSYATAEISKFLIQQKSLYFNSLFENILNFLPLLCALHDVGKIAPDFQNKSAHWKNKYPLGSIDNYRTLNGIHQHYSKDAFFRAMINLPNREEWANILGAHHGELVREKIDDNKPAPSWNKERIRFIEDICKKYGNLPNVPFQSESEWIMLSGLLTIYDYLASNENFFSVDKNFSQEESAKIAKQIFEGEKSKIAFGARFDEKNSANLFPFKLNLLQQECMNIVRGAGIYILEAPMGMGKTEAALLIAHKLISDGIASGIYFALPTKLASNKIFERIRDFLVSSKSTISAARLVHGDSWLDDIYIEHEHHYMAEWFNSSKRALLFPFGVGSIDQALMSILPTKHVFLRNAALSDKVVIIDELHSYDSYTGFLVLTFVKRLRELGATVIILSATLTKSQSSMYLGENTTEKFPRISFVNNENKIIKHIKCNEKKVFQIKKIALEDSIISAIEKAENGLCVLFICNTVKVAQALYGEIKSHREKDNANYDIGLLHSKFTPLRRRELERKWLNLLGKDRTQRPQHGCILVSTQIVEQSVDIDADVIITEICPIDMFLQRAGRCFRHNLHRSNNAKSPLIEVITPDLYDFNFNDTSLENIKLLSLKLGLSTKIYHPYILLKTINYLNKISSISIPDEIESALDYVYEASEFSSKIEQLLYSDLREKENKLVNKAKQIATQFGENTDDFAKTRLYDVKTFECILYQTDEEGNIKLLSGDVLKIDRNFGKYFDKNIARKIHENIIKIPHWIIEKNKKETTDLLGIYNKLKKIVQINIDNNNYFKLGNLNISYSDEIGLSYTEVSLLPKGSLSIKEEFEKFTNYDFDE